MEPSITTMGDHRNSATPSAPSLIPSPVKKEAPPIPAPSPVRELRRPPERNQGLAIVTLVVLVLLFLVMTTAAVIIMMRIDRVESERSVWSQSMQTSVANISGQLDLMNKRDRDVATMSVGFQQGLFDSGSALEAAGADLIAQGDALVAAGTSLNSDKGKELIQQGTKMKEEGVKYQELGAKYKLNSKIAK